LQRLQHVRTAVPDLRAGAGNVWRLGPATVLSAAEHQLPGAAASHRTRLAAVADSAAGTGSSRKAGGSPHARRPAPAGAPAPPQKEGVRAARRAPGGGGGGRPKMEGGRRGGPRLTFNGEATRRDGATRLFNTPALEFGKVFHYDLQAEWQENGRVVAQT